jgi:hypothetical protein
MKKWAARILRGPSRAGNVTIHQSNALTSGRSANGYSINSLFNAAAITLLIDLD